jgi:TolB-like protein
MAEDKMFLLPVVVDDTRDDDERVPERFKEVQWTRLPGGQTPPAFVQRVQRLLAPQPSTASRPAVGAMRSASAVAESIRASWRSKAAVGAIVAVLAGASIYLLVARLWASRQPAAQQLTSTVAAAPAPVTASFAPPPHSIAVLPFVNLSGDKEQEYFSDGLTEELLNSLAAIDGLQVAARTSSFSFKEHPDIVTVAHKLNVASVLEGSVRRSEHTVRVTAQLINAGTGFHLWSKTYDRDLGDVLKLQTEIATEVAESLKVTLLADAAAKIELGGTHNPAAFDAYLRGRKADSRDDAKSAQDAIAAYTEAIRLDQGYALAFAGRSLAYSNYGSEFGTGAQIQEFYEKASADAHQALTLAPELAEGHLALAFFYEDTLDFAQASAAFDRAGTLAPGNARVLRGTGRFAVTMGHVEPGLTALRRGVVLDPLNPPSHNVLGYGFYFSRRYGDAVAAATEAINLDPDFQQAYGFRGLAYYGLGDLERARASCETRPDYWGNQWCLAVTYDKLGRHADAERVLAKFEAALGNAGSYQYATIYAQWGNTAKALEWLDTAMRQRDPGLELVKVDPLMDPLRNVPRFQAIERELKFPE